MKRIFFVYLFFLCAAVAEAKEPPTIEGRYVGTMSLNDSAEKFEMPLAVVLTLTDEFEKVEVSPGVFEMVRVINGNFLVDTEGGPFVFTKVRYRLNTSEIDMRYSRAKGVSSDQPPSYRLIGKVSVDGSISGRVLSGFKGQIGTFKLSKAPLEPLVSHPEYIGVWTGVVKLLPDGDLERFGITIAPTGFSIVNPEQFEFDYTLGKIGHADFGIAQIPLAHVSVDYLHRRVILSDKEHSSNFSITVEANLDLKSGHLKGYVSSLYGGERGIFDLTKLKEGE